MDVAGITESNFLDDIVEWLMVGLLAFMPLAYGAIDAWSEFPVIVAISAMSLLLGFKLLIHPNRRFGMSWAYLAIAVFVTLVLFQVCPLSKTWVQKLSPWTWATKEFLLNDLTYIDPTILDSLPLSFNPNATWEQLGFVIAAGALFVITLNVFSTAQSIRRFLVAISVIGGIVQLIAIVQDITHTNAIYWHTHGTWGDAPARSGPFFNHSHYAQFMNLSMGAALGLLLMLLMEPRPATARSFKRDWQRWVGISSLVLMLFAGAGTITYSYSRGGIIAMVTSAAVTAIVLAGASFFHRKTEGTRSRASIVVGALLVVALAGGMVFWKMDKRIILHEGEGRVQMAHDALKAFDNVKIFGTGLGTHEFVFPMFDTSFIGGVSRYVENEYVQLAEETGILGLACLVLFLLVILLNYVRAIRRNDSPVTVAAFGLGYGLLAVLIHSMSDFGQHLPAIAGLSAVTCGLIVSVTRTRANVFRAESRPAPTPAAPAPPQDAYPEWQPKRQPTGWKTYQRLIVRTLAIFAITAGAVVGSNRAWRNSEAEKYLNSMLAIRAELRQHQDTGTRDQYDALRNYADSVTFMAPHNIHYCYLRGEALWLYIQYAARPAKPSLVDNARFTPQQREMAKGVVAFLNDRRRDCPSYGPLLELTGNIEVLALNLDDVGARLMYLACQTATYDADIQFRGGLMLASLRPEGWWGSNFFSNDERAVNSLQRAVKIEFGKYADVITAVAERLHRPDLAARALVVNPTAISLLSAWAGVDTASRAGAILQSLPESEKPAFQRRLAVAQPIMDAALTTYCNLPDASNNLLIHFAEKLMAQQKYQLALPYLQRALARDPEQSNLHMEVAFALQHTGQREEALKEIDRSLQKNPQNFQAKQIREQLLHPAAMPQ